MEKIPEPIDDFATKNDAEVTPRSSLKKMIGKVAAIGSIAGLGVFGDVDSALAVENNTNNTEHVSKGASLGKFYQKKFEHDDKEAALYKEALKHAKDILLAKGITVTEKSKIEIELKEGILTKIIIDGTTVPVEVKDGVKSNSIPSKKAVSDDAKDYL